MENTVTIRSHIAASQDDEINLSEIFGIIWSAKYWIMLTGLVAAMISIAVTLQLPNIYRSEATLSPVADSKPGALGGLAGQLGGLAGLAGISIGGISGVDKATLAMETLKSRVFLSDFAKRHEMTVPLMAAKGWDFKKQTWIIDPEIYNSERSEWVREVNGTQSSTPSELEVYTQLNKMITIEQDKKTQIVKLSVESLSPVFAQKWVELLIADVNAYIRKKDVAEANRSIEYLTNEIETTSVTQIQSVLYQMIEEQKKTVMLASVRDGYAFQVIDPPVVPELKVRPKRAVIVVISTVMALLFATAIVLVKNAMVGTTRRQA